jgi:hypothetical protein
MWGHRGCEGVAHILLYSENFNLNYKFLYLSMWGSLVHIDGLYLRNEVATFNLLLVACNLGGLLTPHQQLNLFF